MCLCVCVCVCVCVYACVRACVHVCVCVPEAINNSYVIWTSYDWLNKFYGCYMATVSIIINGYSLGIDTHCGN